MPRKSSKTTKKALPAISLSNVTVAYGKQPVLENISFDVKKGQIAALIGPNGSGKTTLLRAILGLLPLEEGEIRLFGNHIHQMHKRIGYVAQRFDFDRDFPLTVDEFLQLAIRPECQEGCIESKIKEVGLTPIILSHTLGSLSGGQLQRVLIAQAILNNPDILFLDEPSTGIDIVGEAAFYDVLRHLNEEHGTTIILVSHDISVVSQLVHSVICINGKLLCVGPPSRTLSDKKLTELYGHDVSHFQHHTH